MQVQRVIDPAVPGREHDGRAVDDDTEVTDQPGIEYGVEIRALGTCAFP